VLPAPSPAYLEPVWLCGSLPNRLLKEKGGILFTGPSLFCFENAVFEKQEFLTFFALLTLIALFNEQYN
jgi:hypothetical protein